jgi:hypothetical protein
MTEKMMQMTRKTNGREEILLRPSLTPEHENYTTDLVLVCGLHPLQIGQKI